MIEAIHTAVAGRARYRVSGLYRDESLKRLLELRLARIKAITRVSANSLTGTLLVCYNTGNTHETIADLIAEVVAEHQNHISRGPLANNPGDVDPSATSADTSLSHKLLNSLLATAADQEKLLVVEIERQRTESVRRIWPFFRDRRIDAYGDLLKRYSDD